MMTQNADKKREQIQMFCMDDLVPQDHLLRLIDQAIDWSFIYEWPFNLSVRLPIVALVGHYLTN